MANLARRDGESDKDYFKRLMDEEYNTIERINLPPRKKNEIQNEETYYIRVVHCENETLGSNIIAEINDIAVTLPLKDFIKETKEDKNRDQYFYRLICVEKIIKRNKMLDLFDEIQHINNIIFGDSKLRGFAVDMLRKNYGSYFANRQISEDILNSAYEELFANICRYNGKYAMTTFAKMHMRKGANDYIKDNMVRLPSYYNEQYNKVRKVQAKMMSMGYSEADANDPSKLKEFKELERMSLGTIAATLEIKDTMTFETFDPDYSTGMNGKLGSPEEEYIKKERADAFNSILSQLRKFQEFLLYAMNGERKGIKETPESIGRDIEFIDLLKQDGFFNLIKTDPDGNEFVRKEHVIELYNQTMLAARTLAEQTKVFSKKTKEVRDNYLSNHGIVIANKNYEIVTDEDEDLIFSLDDDDNDSDDNND